jgi:hypothetical protein
LVLEILKKRRMKKKGHKKIFGEDSRNGNKLRKQSHKFQTESCPHRCEDCKDCKEGEIAFGEIFLRKKKILQVFD